ncbi:MAG: FdhF/YdeP family oxidoreductase [Porticoccaceae bacterium]|nr:FdhF/YdeP family oxidoreductase [Pseudomonadales bacterium]MCP5173431.1 FdhF/YdeP family oxidoreductase [Pseudomonadales bacterium]MCP5303244.1 FdhF/YdeP family oxidoreductase [Pseudomonadales bacterium]
MSDNQVPNPAIVGGGPKKILYTLNTVRRIGLKNSAKALRSNNACKACGLGMGGQRGGMTNELGEFPAVCNKSIQAQSTDIQPPIPKEVFDHPLTEFKKLSGREMERLGRLNTPLFKAKDEDYFQPVTWDWALNHAAKQFAEAQPDQTFFYSSGRSSNEAGFALQLLARLYGTNNVNNCSYYCHQATGVGLGNSIGTGTATVELDDLNQCDLVFLIGANPASNHPRLMHKLQGVRERGGDIIVVNPAKEPGLVRFAVPKSAKSMLSGGTWIASQYLQPRIATDLALFTAIGKALLESGAINQSFIDEHTSGFDVYRQQLEAANWQSLCQQTGISKQQIQACATSYANADKVVFAWGMGMTHHLHGVENVEAIANLSLLRGMLGRPGAGLLPLRGHSNVQGIGTIGVKPVLAAEVLSKIEQNLGVNLPSKKGLDTLACIRKAYENNMAAALIMGGNLFEATPDSAWAEQAFNRIGFKLYLTTTLNRGHVRGMDSGEALILPVTARDEEFQPTTQESMFNYVRLSDGGIQRLAGPRPEVEILCELGKRLLPDNQALFDGFKSHKTIREAIANIVPGMQELADIDVARKEFSVKGRLLHTAKFNTPDGKARFVAHSVPQEKKHNNTYPYTLMSVRSEGQFNSIIYEERDSYRGTDQRQVVMMSAEDMKLLKIKQGSQVSVRSEHGVMRSLTVHQFDLPAGNLMVYYPEANVLIGRKADPRSQTPAFKSVAVAVDLDQ